MRGVALAAAFGRGIEVFEYAPTQVKLVVTGYGQAEKVQVAKMVRLTLGMNAPEHKSLGADATDALAVAICHASQNVGLHPRKDHLETSRNLAVYRPERGTRIRSRRNERDV